VTDQGIARLLGKSVRERAEELINVAHPDHRDWLRDEAKRLYYP
jgi:4-hydroxybutyrate CoA-transferase